MLRMKRKHLAVEVTGSPGANGGHPFDGRRNKCLLVKAQHAKPVSDEVQASEEEGLGRLKDRRPTHPNRWESGEP